MSSDITEHPSFENPTVSSREPSRRCRHWLLIGMIMLAADLVLGVLATVLEFRHWGKEGFTPDVVVSYITIVPQILLLTSYLVLAREVGARGLWKSVAGMLGSYPSKSSAEGPCRSQRFSVVSVHHATDGVLRNQKDIVSPWSRRLISNSRRSALQAARRG